MPRSVLALAACVLVLSACCHLGGDDEEYDPCEDKEEGEACTLCPPDDEDCIETMELKVCDASGECGGEPDAQHAHDGH